MLYYIPVEPLEERYTEQWYCWFPEEFKRQDLPFQVIDGISLTDTIETGTFLDINSTLYYKAEQLKKIAVLFYEKKVKSGDVFFVADIEFWGIESIRYLSDLNNIPVRIVGFCHAASYTKEDFMAKCESYGRYFEQGWFEIFDKVLVGSNYHKQQIIKHGRCANSEKITVTGNPYDFNELTDFVESSRQKKNRIILTNRPDAEKRPHITLGIFAQLKRLNPSWEFLVVTSRRQWGKGWIRELGLRLQEQNVIEIKEGLSKKEYLQLLCESKVMVSNTIEENFGYCVLEALICDTVPIVPNDFSHPELIPDSRCLFNSELDQLKKIVYAMNHFSVVQYADKYRNSLTRIVSELS